MRKVSYFYLTWLYAFSTLTVYLHIGYGAYVGPLLMNVFNCFCVNKLFQAFRQQLLSLSSLADTNESKNHLPREEIRKDQNWKREFTHCGQSPRERKRSLITCSK